MGAAGPTRKDSSRRPVVRSSRANEELERGPAQAGHGAGTGADAVLSRLLRRAGRCPPVAPPASVVGSVVAVIDWKEMKCLEGQSL